MILAALLVFASGLLVGYAVFTGIGAGVLHWPKMLTFGSAAKTADLGKKGLKTPDLGKAGATKKFGAKAAGETKKLESYVKGLSSKLFSKKTSPASAASPAAAESAKKGTEPAVVAAAEPPAAPPPPPEEYTLQLGAFTDLKKAKQLQDSLREKGYTATIFEGIDTGYRPWHAVRMSKFTDIESATKAAAEFTQKERLQAIVRPSGQL